ncbi:MAG: hypothetical protein QOC98_3258 [Frankiaceae bacterium]|nr:hypothetical protein [Frankiaceae bacterium]
MLGCLGAAIAKRLAMESRSRMRASLLRSQSTDGDLLLAGGATSLPLHKSDEVPSGHLGSMGAIRPISTANGPNDDATSVWTSWPNPSRRLSPRGGDPRPDHAGHHGLHHTTRIHRRTSRQGTWPRLCAASVPRPSRKGTTACRDPPPTADHQATAQEQTGAPCRCTVAGKP